MENQAMEQLAQRVNADERLVWRGRYLNTTFLLEQGDVSWLIKISAGRVESVRRGPFVMPSWTFAFRASHETWAQFWMAHPQPGFHDLLAMVRYRTLRLDGDMYPFMSNLLYFKEVIAALRPREAI